MAYFDIAFVAKLSSAASLRTVPVRVLWLACRRRDAQKMASAKLERFRKNCRHSKGRALLPQRRRRRSADLFESAKRFVGQFFGRVDTGADSSSIDCERSPMTCIAIGSSVVDPIESKRTHSHLPRR